MAPFVAQSPHLFPLSPHMATIRYNVHMQRTEDGYIIISCDFCGTDWDEVRPMIEGHHGSVLCLECLKTLLGTLTPAAEKFQCTMCLRSKPAGTPQWRPARPPDAPPPGLNCDAVICHDCVEQAADTYTRDQDIDWVRPDKQK